MNTPRIPSGFLSCCAMAVLTASPVSVFGQSSFYAGAGAVSSQLEPRVNDSGFSVTEKSSAGARLFAGVDLSERVSLEGYYAHLGSASLTDEVIAGDIEYQAGGLAGLWYLYGSRDLAGRHGLQVYGRLGVGFLNNESTNGIGFTRLNNEHLATGLGVEYGLNNGYGVRFEFVNHDVDARDISFSLLKRFGEDSSNSSAVPETETMQASNATDAVPVQDKDGAVSLAELDEDGDGVNDDSDLCAGTASGTEVSESGCVSPMAVMDVKFASGLSILSSQATVALDLVIAELSDNPDLRIVIRSHTDNRGLAANNMELSRQRAVAVVRYLSDSGGINLERLEAIGFGESQPVQSNKTAEGRRANRRVEIEVLQ